MFIASEGEAEPCGDDFEVFSFTATEDETGQVTLTGASASLSNATIELLSAGDFVFCFQVVANFNGTVVIQEVNITLGGTPDDGGDDGDFFTCSSPGGEDNGVEFGDPGTTRVIASTLGEGRHMALASTWPLIYEFDQPVRYCAVIPDHFTLTDLTTGAVIPIPEANLLHQHLAQDGVVIRSRVSIVLPEGLTTGDDYELVISGRGLSLDGEFQVNGGTNLAANGTLPSGDGTPGGDFVQIFRAVTIDTYLTNTPRAGAMELDPDDRLYVVGDAGLFGPFDTAGEVTDGDRLGTSLPQLSDRNVVMTSSGTLIVKEDTSDGSIFEVDPTTGTAMEVAVAGNLNINPKASVLAPEGYSSIEMAGVQAGDIIFADDSGITALDLAAGTGLKGGLRIVERDNEISSAYLNMWTPPMKSGKPGEIWAGHKPEDADDGFRVHRILPNGLEDSFILPRTLFGLDGTSVTHLQDSKGRREFLILGTITDSTAFELGKQLLPADFDGRGIFIFDATRNRLQVVAPLTIDAFTFASLDAFSQVLLTSDYDRAYISMPSESVVYAMDGLANSDADEDWPCDSVYDDGIDFGAEGSARVVASSFGLGNYVLAGAPTVVEFEFDLPLRYCQCNADNVTLMDVSSGSEIALGDRDVKRIPIYAGNQIVASRIMIDLPMTLTTGVEYQLTLSGDGLNIDGEFTGTLPSGDGSPGGDFVQTFWLIEGSNFLTETRHAVGITIDSTGQLFIANETQPYGPFATAKEVTDADAVGSTGVISGGGRPITAGAVGTLFVAGRNNGPILAVDVATGTTDTLVTSLGGTFEIGLMIAPPGYNGALVSEGDIIVANSQRGSIANVAGGSGSLGQFFSDPATVGDDWQNFFVPPTPLFGPAIYGSFQAGRDNAFSVLEIGDDGVATPLFAPLVGVDGVAAARLPDADGNAQYLLLADFDQAASPDLPTKQLRGATDGYELLVYNAGNGHLSVLGAVSRGVTGGDDFSTVEADPDFAFTADVNTVYLTQPRPRTVVELTGFAR